MKTNDHELKPYKRVIAAEDPNKPVKSPIYLDMEYTSVIGILSIYYIVPSIYHFDIISSGQIDLSHFAHFS